MIGIPMGMNCAPVLADLFQHAYEADFLQGLLKNKDSSFCSIDDILSLNNSRVSDLSASHLSK
jgi:hypothetical protein